MHPVELCFIGSLDAGGMLVSGDNFLNAQKYRKKVEFCAPKNEISKHRGRCGGKPIVYLLWADRNLPRTGYAWSIVPKHWFYFSVLWYRETIAKIINFAH